MDINNSANVLGSLLGINQAQALQKTQSTQAVSSQTASASSAAFDGDLARVSTAGTMVASTNSDVRPEKVAAIQMAIASGNYNVSAAAVASKLVASMLGE